MPYIGDAIFLVVAILILFLMKEGGIMEITLLDNLLSVLTSIITITPTFTRMAGYVLVFLFQSILIVSLSFLGIIKGRSILGSSFFFCFNHFSNLASAAVHSGVSYPYFECISFTMAITPLISCTKKDSLSCQFIKLLL